MMHMQMSFYSSREATILFSSWKTDSWTGYSLSLVALFVVGTFYQYMEGLRMHFKSLAKSKPAPPVEIPLLLPRTVTRRGWHPARFAVAVLFGVNAAIGYLLMLAVMSFNGGVFIAVVLGLTTGYLFFRSDGEDDLSVFGPPCACA